MHRTIRTLLALAMLTLVIAPNPVLLFLAEWLLR
jgi:hypothetical protein